MKIKAYVEMYKTKNGEIITVNVKSVNATKEVANIRTKEDKGFYPQSTRVVRKDKGGRYFTWNGEKIYLDNYIKLTMRELRSKVYAKDVTLNDLENAIIHDSENATFYIPVCHTPSIRVLYDEKNGIIYDFKIEKYKIDIHASRAMTISFEAVHPNDYIPHKIELGMGQLMGYLNMRYIEIVLPDDEAYDDYDGF